MTTDPAASECAAHGIAEPYTTTFDYIADPNCTCPRTNVAAPVPAAPVSDVEALAREICERQWGTWDFLRDGRREQYLRTARVVLAAGYVSPTQAAKDRAEARAAALREAADAWEQEDTDAVGDWLRDRANRLAGDSGA